MTFEDQTDLARCIKSDCRAYRAGGTPLCAQHLREQEQRSAGIVEPDVEEKARAAGDAVMKLIGQDPDTQELPKDYLGVPSVVEARPDPTELDPAAFEPHWDEERKEWVLREKQRDVDLDTVRSLVRDLMYVLGIREEGGDDHG